MCLGNYIKLFPGYNKNQNLVVRKIYMENFAVAVPGLEAYRHISPNTFNIFEEFSKKYNLCLNIFEFRQNCDYFDAYLGDTKLLNCSEQSFFSHTLEHEDISIIVPNLMKIPRFEYLLSFSFLTYGFLILFYILVFLFASIQTIIAKIMKKRIDFVDSLLIGFVLLIGSSSKLPTDIASRLLYIILIFIGFFNNTLYSVFFGSFLIKGIPYINSAIYCTKDILQYFKDKLPNFKDFEFEEVEWNALVYNLMLLKTEHGTCITKSMWNFFFKFQRQFKTNVFRLAAGWISGFTTKTFIIFNTKTKFSRDWKNFTESIFCTGLFEKWVEADAHYLKNLSEFKSESEIVDFEDARNLLKILLFGYILAGLAFALEVIFKSKHIVNFKNNLLNILIPCKDTILKNKRRRIWE